MIWAGHTSHAEEKTNTYTVLIGPPKELIKLHEYRYTEISFSSTQPFTVVPVLTGTGVNSSAKEYLKLLHRKSHNGKLFVKVITRNI